MLSIRIAGASDGDDAYARVLGFLDLAEVQEVWPEVVAEIIHPWFLEKAAENIDRQGQLVGEHWSYAGEPEYMAYKLEKVGHTQVMRWDRGGEYERLYPGLTDPMSPWHLFVQRANSVRIGTWVPYAKRLTRGGTGPFGEDYPGRSLLPSTGSLNKKLTTRIQRAIKDKIYPLSVGDVRGFI